MLDRITNGTSGPWIISAIGLILIGLIGWDYAYLEGRETARQNYNAERSREQAAREDYQVCLAKPTIKEALTCYSSADKAAEEDYRSYSDLSAQWQSAQWTKTAAWSGAFVGVLTLIAAGLAAWFARGAILETRRIGEAQARAYLSIGPVQVNSLGQLRVKYTIHNDGSSPARDIATSAILTFRYSAVGDRLTIQLAGACNAPSKEMPVSLSSTDIQLSFFNQRPVTKAEAESLLVSIRSTVNKVDAQIWIFYDDVFGTFGESHYVGTHNIANSPPSSPFIVPPRSDRVYLERLRGRHREMCEPFRDWTSEPKTPAQQ